MEFAKVRLESDDVCARALKALATRMRITVLADERFVVPEAGLEWLETGSLPFQIVDWVNQDDALQTPRDNLAHPV